MTREEAIKGLKSLVEVRRKYCAMQTMKDEIECLDKAIKALEQQPCGDAISRQAVLNLPRKTLKNYFGEVVGDVIYVKDVIELPPVTPQPKMGRWIEENPPMVERYPFCSECGFVNPFENALNYCPNCGAKMQEVEE